MSKKTRQGVRDLNDIKAPLGRKLDLPEEQAVDCKHKYTKRTCDGFVTECRNCDASWDTNELVSN